MRSIHFCKYCWVILLTNLFLIQNASACLSSKIVKTPIIATDDPHVTFKFTVSSTCMSRVSIVKVILKKRRPPHTIVCLFLHINGTCRSSTGCTCQAGEGEYTVTKRVTDSGAAFELIAILNNGRTFKKPVKMQHKNYPPLIKSMSVLCKGQSVDEPVPPNSSVTIICTWDRGYPPLASLPRLVDRHGQELAITNHSEPVNTIQHVIPVVQCKDAGEFVCEIGKDRSRMGTTLLVRCSMQSSYAQRQYTTRSSGHMVCSENIRDTYSTEQTSRPEIATDGYSTDTEDVSTATNTTNSIISSFDGAEDKSSESLVILVVSVGATVIVIIAVAKCVRNRKRKSLPPPPTPCKMKHRASNAVVFRQNSARLPGAPETFYSVNSHIYFDIPEDNESCIEENLQASSCSSDSIILRIACPSDSSGSESYAVAYGCTVVNRKTVPGNVVHADVHPSPDNVTSDNYLHPITSEAEATSSRTTETTTCEIKSAPATPTQDNPCEMKTDEYPHPTASPFETDIAAGRKTMTTTAHDLKATDAPTNTQDHSRSLRLEDYSHPTASQIEAETASWNTSTQPVQTHQTVVKVSTMYTGEPTAAFSIRRQNMSTLRSKNENKE